MRTNEPKMNDDVFSALHENIPVVMLFHLIFHVIGEGFCVLKSKKSLVFPNFQQLVKV